MPSSGTSSLEEPNIHVSLTHSSLDPGSVMDRVRSPEAGAIVLFAGTTRDNFNSRPVLNLSYQSYVPLALRTMLAIARTVLAKHSLKAIAIVHRLGVVPVGEESILIAVSSPHRKEAWLAGEECLEQVKARVEIWKLEVFEDDEGGVWRANKDGVMGERVEGGRDGKVGETEGDDKEVKVGKEVPETMGPVVRPRRPGERGHGAVVNPKPKAPPE